MSFETNGVILPEHFGFCEGVVAADQLLKNVSFAARSQGIPTIYGYHDIVHNATVTGEHVANGVKFIDNPDDVPDRSIVVPSAHGSGPQVMYRFAEKKCLVLDGACPLVLHTHLMAQVARRKGEHVVYVVKGKPEQVAKLHDEVAGTTGHLDYTLVGSNLVHDPIPRTYVELSDDPEEIAARLAGQWDKFRIITQTTLDDLACFTFRDDFTEAMQLIRNEAKVSVSRRGDVCPAVRQRLEGVRVLLRGMQKEAEPSALLVVTDRHSKKGMGYHDLGQATVQATGMDTKVFAIETVEELEDLKPQLRGRKIGVTASASTPDRDVLAVLADLGIDESTLEFERPTFNLFHSDRTPLNDPYNIARLIKEWQEAA